MDANKYSVKIGIKLDEGSLANLQSELNTKLKDKKVNITMDSKNLEQIKDLLNNIYLELGRIEKKNGFSNATKGTKEFNNELDKTAKRIKNTNFATDNWMYNWSKAMQSFLTYNTVTQFFNTISNGIKDMINQVIELDDALVELKKVTDLEGESLEQFIDNAYEAGRTVAKTGTEMIESATAFAKAGYKDEALELGTVAAMYTNIADEEISAADAADMIIAQMKAFNITANDSMHIIDAINEVSNNFAVSSADISRNLGKASAVMANAGNSMEQYIGLMTAATEVTRNASKAANGLKTLTLRLQGMNEEGEKDLEVQAQMEGLFRKLGISVYKANGELKNTYEILETLAPVYQTLTNAEKAYVTETIAGKYQAQNAAAILNNWTTAVEATETAMNSAGSAARENEKVLDSIQGHIQSLNAAWEQLSRNAFSQEFIKRVIDFGTVILNIANSGFGRWISQSALIGVAFLSLVTVISKGVKAFQNFKLALDNWKKSGLNVSTIIQVITNKEKLLKLQTDINNIGTKKATMTLDEAKLAMQSYGISIDNVKTKEQAQIVVNEALKASTLSLNLALGALSLVIGAVITLWQSHKQKAEQAAEASRQAAKEMADESYNAFQESKKALQEYTDEITALKKTLESAEKGSKTYKDAQDKLEETQKKLIDSYPEWKDKIEETNGHLEEELELLKEINVEEAKKAERDLRANKNQIEKDFDIQNGKGKWNGEDARRYGLNLEDFDENKIDKITTKMQELENVGKDSWQTYAFWGDSVMDTYNAYDKLYEYIDKNGEKELGLTKKETEALKDKIAASKSAIEADYNYKENIEGLKQYAEAFLETSDAYKEFIKDIEEQGKKGLLDKDYITALLPGYEEELTDYDKEHGIISSDMGSSKYEEISKWMKILGIDAEDLAEKYNIAENKMSSFMEEVDSERLQAYRNELKQLGENNKEQSESIAEVVNSYNDFYDELKNLDEINEESVSNLLEKYPALKKALKDNGKTVQDVIGDMEDYHTEAANFYNINDVMDYSEGVETSLNSIDEKYKDVIDTLEKYGYTIEDINNYENSAIRIFDEINERLGISIGTVKELHAQFDTLQEDVESLSGSYNTLSGAVDEYNEHGYLTIDTLMNLLDLEDGWINALNFENGQMSINEDSIRSVMNARLDEADALAIQTAYSQLQDIAAKGEAGAVEYLKGKYGELKTALDNTALSYDDVAEAAARYKAVEGISESETKAIDDIMDSLDKRLKMTADFRKKSSQNFGGSMGKSSKSSGGSSSSSKEWWQQELDNLKDQYDNSEITINEYINSLQNLLGKVGQGTEAWKKINKELQKQKLDKIKEDYNAGRISLNQYIIALQNLQKEYKQSTKEWNNLADAIKKAKLDQLKEQQNDLKSALSAVNNVLEKQIDEYKDLKEAADDRYDDELDKLNDLKDSLDDKNDDYERAQKAVVDFLNEQLDAINEQKDTVENYYDNVIEAIEKMNQDTQESIELAEAYEALMNAMTQKTKKVYKEGLGWVWTTDAEAIKEAKKTYDDLINSATTKEIEEQKDKTVKSLEEQIESLQNYIDSWDKVFDKFDNEKNRNLADILLGENWSEMVSNLDPQIVDDFSDAYYELQKNLEETEKQIEELNKQKEEEDEYWDKLIEDLQNYKGEWADVASVYEEAQNALKARQIMGANWEKEILDRRLDVLENFKNKYNAILAEIDKVDNMSTDQASGYTALRLPGYANGGEVDYTGLAVLHGTPNKPEYVLNNSQMRNLLGNLTKPRTTSVINNKNGAVVNNYNFGDIELPNVTNAQQFANELKSMLNITKNQ